jgi:prepilin-type N-terminal cleavage/methylation domain-containing protein
MHESTNRRSERGFSLVELVIAISIMLIVGGAVISISSGALKVSTTTFELTDAQEAVRASQEYINRDLTNAGDGLNSLNNIRVRSGFVTAYLSKNTSIDNNNFGILTSDNDIPANTTVVGTNPAVTVRSSPGLTDRITMLSRDSTFVAYTPQSTSANGDVISISSTDAGLFTIGEIYFITCSGGSTFGAITGKTTASGVTSLAFANGDTLGLNLVRNGAVSTGQISAITNGGLNPVTLLRMQMIHYYVNSDGLLMRRVFGVKGAAYSESMIAEHIVSLRFRYILDSVDVNGNVAQPINVLTSALQTATRQVEVTVTAETPHSVGIAQTTGTLQQSSGKVQTSMTTSTSIRNMQFKQALQPLAGG